MNAMKEIVVAVSVVLISAIAPVGQVRQGSENAPPRTLIAPLRR